MRETYTWKNLEHPLSHKVDQRVAAVISSLPSISRSGWRSFTHPGFRVSRMSWHQVSARAAERKKAVQREYRKSRSLQVESTLRRLAVITTEVQPTFRIWIFVISTALILSARVVRVLLEAITSHSGSAILFPPNTRGRCIHMHRGQSTVTAASAN